MSTSTHPIIVLSDSYVEDAFFSTNTPDYTTASPDYSPASPRNTSSNPSEDLSKDLLASLTISPFHDDPYMKVMQAYNATNNEFSIPLLRAPIPPPTVLPPSLVLPLSPLFNPRDFFLPEEILPSQKRARFLSSSSTDFSTPPQVFEMGESSHKTSSERHEEQIETILNHLDELPLKRIEHMEDKIESLESKWHDDEIFLARIRTSTLEILIEDIQCDVSYLYVSRMAPKRTSTSVAPAMTQATIRKLVTDSVSAALEAQAATMAITNNTNTKPREAHVVRKCSYKEFMSCQPLNFKGTEGVVVTVLRTAK
ncbi:hypothetical protein Tco_0664889 [Tanacetum coccineum]